MTIDGHGDMEIFGAQLPGFLSKLRSGLLARSVAVRSAIMHARHGIEATCRYVYLPSVFLSSVAVMRACPLTGETVEQRYSSWVSPTSLRKVCVPQTVTEPPLLGVEEVLVLVTE